MDTELPRSLLERLQDWFSQSGATAGRAAAQATTPRTGSSILGALLEGPSQPQPVQAGDMKGLYPMWEVRQMARYPAALGSLVSSPFSAVMQGGKPTRVYHGTPKTFEQFATEHADPNGLYGPGFYFTENPQIASGYAAQKGVPRSRSASPNVRPAYLDIIKPFDADAQVNPKELAAKLAQLAETLPRGGHEGAGMAGLAQDIAKMAGEWGVKPTWSGAEFYRLAAHALGKEGATDMLKRLGYDGITHVGGKISGGEPHRVWIAFDPKQIVSAFTAHGELP